MNRRAVVLGSTGFVGKALSRELRTEGFDVTGVSRSPDTSPPHTGPKRRIVLDISQPEALGPFLPHGAILISCLASTSPAQVGISPPFDSSGFLARLIDVAASRGVSQFAFSSSGGTVYGEQVSEAGWKEESLLDPISSYGIAKASAEKAVLNECDSRQIRSLIWRFSNLFGPDQVSRTGQGLVPAAIKAATAGGLLELFGGRGMVRDFVYVDDAVRAAVVTLRTRSMQSIFNIGSGHGRQVGEVLDLIEDVFGGTISTVEVEKPAGFIEKNFLDTSKLSKEFPGLTFRSLEEGIRQIYSANYN